VDARSRTHEAGRTARRSPRAYPLPREPYRVFYLAHAVATSITYRQPVLLWITASGLWPSSENWHLYYKLRESYGDRLLLDEAPGHLFLEHEAEDLASFLQLAMLSGWDGYVLTHADYVNAFFSHDEYIDFFAKLDDNLGCVRKEFRAFISPSPPE
jgi:hypothetical protein